LSNAQDVNNVAQYKCFPNIRLKKKFLPPSSYSSWRATLYCIRS